MADPSSKLTIEEFAASIKQRAPELASVPDDVLVRKVLERRPEMISFIQTSEPRPPMGKKSEGPGVGDYLYSGVAAPAGRVAKGLLWDFPKSVLFSGNVAGTAGNLAQQLKTMLDAGATSAESGEGRAGQTLSMMENAPLIGEAVKRVESEGPGRFRFGPETLGAMTEGAGYLLAPEAIAKSLPKGTAVALQKLSGAGKEPVLDAAIKRENRIARLNEAYKARQEEIAKGNSKRAADHAAETAKVLEAHRQAEAEALAKHQQALDDYNNASAEKKAEHTQKVIAARRDWVEKAAKAKAAERQAAQVDAARDTKTRGQQEYGENLRKNLKKTYQTVKARLDSRWNKLRSTPINRAGKLSILNDELGDAKALKAGMETAEQKFLHGSPGSIRQFRDLAGWIERGEEEGTLKNPTWDELRTHYSSLGDALYGGRQIAPNVMRALKYMRDDVIGAQLESMAGKIGVGGDYTSLLKDSSQFEADWRDTQSITRKGGSPLAVALQAPNAATLIPQVTGATGDLLMQKLGKYTDAGASPATAAAIRKLHGEISNLPTVRVPDMPARMKPPAEVKLGEPPEPPIVKPPKLPEAPEPKIAKLPRQVPPLDPAAIRRQKILNYTGKEIRYYDVLPPHVLAKPFLSSDAIREWVATFPRKETPLPKGTAAPRILPPEGDQ